MNRPLYLVAIYTAGLGGTTQKVLEISGVGLYQLGELAYASSMNGIV